MSTFDATRNDVFHPNNHKLRSQFLSFRLQALFCWRLTWKLTLAEERRRNAKLIFLWLLLDYVCLWLLLSAHISYLSGAKLYFPVSLCALSFFSLFESSMLDGNLTRLWFKFIDMSTESFCKQLCCGGFYALWMGVMRRTYCGGLW